MTILTIDKPGIYVDVSSELYFADPCPVPSLTQSIAKTLIDQSPLHAKEEHPRLREHIPDEADEKYVAAQAIGNAAHLILIGRGKTVVSAPYDDWRKKEAQAFKAEQIAAGNCPVLAKHLDEAQMMALAVKLRLADAKLTDAFNEGGGEVVIVAQDGDVWLRSLVDWMVSPALMYDLKTSAASYAPHNIGLKIETDGWHIQAAFQERILDLIDPLNAGRRKFRFIAVENYAPYCIVPVELDEHWMTLGRKKVAFAVDQWRRCTASGIWPGYPLELHRPEYPQYREAAWLKRETEESERRSINPNLMLAG